MFFATQAAAPHLKTVGFHTAFTGELYEAIAQHSVVLAGAPPSTSPGPAFDEGVAVVRDNPAAGVESLVFAVRARQIGGELARADAGSFLSGLIIGADVRSAAAAFDLGRVSIRIICSAQLADLYARALVAFGYASSTLSGAETVLAGLYAAYRA